MLSFNPYELSINKSVELTFAYPPIKVCSTEQALIEHIDLLQKQIAEFHEFKNSVRRALSLPGATRQEMIETILIMDDILQGIAKILNLDETASINDVLTSVQELHRKAQIPVDKQEMEKH